MQIKLNTYLSTVLKLALGVLLIVFLGKQLLEYGKWWDAQILLEPLRSLSSILLLVLILVGTVLVWLLEAFRWKALCSPFEHLATQRALKAVLAGAAVGSVMPGRAFQFGGKVIYLKQENLSRGVLQSIKSSLSLWFWYSLFALLAFSILDSDYLPIKYESVRFLALACAVMSCVWLFFFFKFQNIDSVGENIVRGLAFDGFPKNTDRQNWEVLVFTALKIIISALQYYALLQIFGVDLPFLTCTLLVLVIFFIQAVIPGSLFIDLPLRTNLSLFFLSPLSDNITAILLAPSILWLINLAIPSLLGYYYILKAKNKNHVASP